MRRKATSIADLCLEQGPSTGSDELSAVHDVFDRMGLPEGTAVDRLASWAVRRLRAMRGAQHTDGCQCVSCHEVRVVLIACGHSLADASKMAGNDPSPDPRPCATERLDQKPGGNGPAKPTIFCRRVSSRTA